MIATSPLPTASRTVSAGPMIASELDSAEQQLQQLRHSYLPGAWSAPLQPKEDFQPSDPLPRPMVRRLSSDFEVVEHEEEEPSLHNLQGTHEHAISHLLRRRSVESVEGFVELVHQHQQEPTPWPDQAAKNPEQYKAPWERQRLPLANPSTGRRILVPVFTPKRGNTFDLGAFFAKLASVVLKTSDDLVDVIILDGVPELGDDLVALPTDQSAVPEHIAPVCIEAFRWLARTNQVEVLVSPAAPSLPAELQRRDAFQSDLCVVPADLPPSGPFLSSWQDVIDASAIPVMLLHSNYDSDMASIGK